MDRRLTYANVVSTLALVIAISGGTVYAASQIGSGQIKRNAVHSKHIRDGQVKRADLADSDTTGFEDVHAVKAADSSGSEVYRVRRSRPMRAPCLRVPTGGLPT